jgi:MFS family permease
MRLSTRFGVLSEASFRWLWLARSTSSIGDALVPVAIAFAVLDLAGPGELGIVSAAYMGTRMVFVVIGGVWADRLPRQLVMIAADVVRAVTQGVVALAFFAGAVEWWHLAVSSSVFGAASAFFGPASTGLVPKLVPAARLQEANALLGLSRNSIEVFGPALSGVLVATVGYEVVFAVDALSFVASGLFLLAMRLPRALPSIPKQSFLADAKDGLAEVRARPWLWVAFANFAIGNLAMAPYFVLGPLVLEQQFGGARDWGLMMTGGAIGGLVAGAIALRWKPSRPLLFSFPLMLFLPLEMSALAVPVPLPLLVAGAGLVVLGIVLGNVLWQTVEQQQIPNEKLARVDAFDWMVSLVFMPIGYVAAGPLAERIGVAETLLLAAGLSAVAELAPLLVPSIRNMRYREDEAPPALDPVAA